VLWPAYRQSQQAVTGLSGCWLLGSSYKAADGEAGTRLREQATTWLPALSLPAHSCHLDVQPITAQLHTLANQLAVTDRSLLCGFVHWSVGAVSSQAWEWAPLLLFCLPVCVFLLFTLHIGSDSAVSMHELWIKGKCLLVLMGFYCNVRVDSVRSGAHADASCHSLPAVSRHRSGSGAVSLCDLTC